MRSSTSGFPGAVIPKLLSLPNIQAGILPTGNHFQFHPLSAKQREKQMHLLEVF